MKHFEYVKWFVEDCYGSDPPVLIYEVDLDNERYATRMAHIYDDGRVVPIMEDGFEFVTEAAIPEIDEINAESGYYAENISKEEFERIYSSSYYDGSTAFPKQLMEDQLEKLNTPFGEVVVIMDGKPLDYTAQKGSDNDAL